MNTDSGSMNAQRPAVPLRVDHGYWPPETHTGVPCPACGAGIIYNGNYHCSKYTDDAPECTWALPESNDTDPMFQRCYAGLMAHRPHVRVSWRPGTLEWHAHVVVPSRDRSAYVLFAALSVMILGFAALEVFLPVLPWPWLVVRLVGLPLAAYWGARGSAWWYLHAGRLPRWWLS